MPACLLEGLVLFGIVSGFSFPLQRRGGIDKIKVDKPVCEADGISVAHGASRGN